MPFKTILVAALLIPSLTPGQPTADSRPQGTPTPTLAARIDALARPLVVHRLTVGLVVGVYCNGRKLVRGHGQVRRGRPGRPDGDTVYEIGSVSKVFTGILLADAVTQKLVRLEDPAQKHLPATVEMPTHEGRPVRLLHLTTHTSALPRMPVNFHPGNPKNPYADYDAEKLYAGLARTRLSGPPGTRYLYSNLGAGLLGHVLTLAHGAKSYDALLQKRIAGPLGLASTRVSLTDDMKKRLAPPCTDAGRPRSNWDLNALAGAGGIRSTVNDMLMFAAHNLATPPDSAHAELHLGMRLAQEPRFRRRMAMGWHLGRRPHTVWHNGATGGYRAYFVLELRQKIAVVVLANTNSRKIDELANRILATVLGERVGPVQFRKTVDVRPEVLARYVGEYRLSQQHSFTVTADDGQLFVQLTGQPSLPVFATSKTRFFYRAVQAEIEFHVGAEGRVEALTLFQEGREQRADRVE